MPFDSPDIILGQLLTDVHAGKVQLPDFQRAWKWDTDRIRGLLASISLGYPVGVVMMLEVGGEEVRFQPRPISGAPADGVEPIQLVLDGQQRLTSLYQSLKSGQVVDTADARGKRLKRWYYLDIDKCLDPDEDREEAVVAVPEDRRMKANFDRDIIADYSTMELECAAGMFPLDAIFDQPKQMRWYGEYTSGDPERVEKMNRFVAEVLSNIMMYTVPVIILKKDTPKEAVCTVFEKVNTGGVVLNVFELLTATFAADDFRLGEDWAARKARLDARPVLQGVEGVDFMQVIALLTSLDRRRAYLDAGGDPATAPGVGCKRKDVLRLTLNEYLRWADAAEQGLMAASEFLTAEYIFRAKDLPYRTQRVPLAAIHAVLGAQARQHGGAAHIRQWFWAGVFGELYGGSVETRFALDVLDVPAWVESGGSKEHTPRTVEVSNFVPNRLLTLRTRNSAAYKGLFALVLRGSQDWQYRQDINGATFSDQAIDIHHIFPQAYCDSAKIDVGKRESIVNKTPIAASTNRMIGGVAPSVYLPRIEQRGQMSSSMLDDVLAGHRIDPAALRSDDFDAFFTARSEALLSLIEDATGKAIARDVPDEADAEDLFEESDVDVAADDWAVTP